MNKEKFKNCVVIYNPASSRFNEKTLDKVAEEIIKQNINPTFLKSAYKGNIAEIIKEVDNLGTLIVTLGGDGTVKEAYTALNQIEQQGVYAHVPCGTTNDMSKNYDVKSKEPDKVMKDILNGEIKMFDTYSINGQIAAYTSVFGYLAHVPFITPSYLKKYFGYVGYLISATKEIIKRPVKYDITYETESESKRGEFILGAVSNSKGFAGINLYNDASLNDGKIELLLIKNMSSKLIVSIARDFLKNSVDLAKYSEYITLIKASEIKLTFNDNFPKYAVDVDGENSKIIPNYVDRDLFFKTERSVKILKTKE